MSTLTKRSLPPPPTPENLGTAIRALRKERNLTIEDLAAAAHIHWTYLSGIEREGYNLTWKILVGIADALAITPSELVRWAEEMAADRSAHEAD